MSVSAIDFQQTNYVEYRYFNVFFFDFNLVKIIKVFFHNLVGQFPGSTLTI